MAKKARPYFMLECEKCKNRNYSTSKNPKNTTDRIVLQKYCKHDQAVTAHKESK